VVGTGKVAGFAATGAGFAAGGLRQAVSPVASNTMVNVVII
jgi:hypothetical protein